MTDDKRCFIDTNVLLVASDTDRPNHSEAIQFLESGLSGKTRLFTNGQVFREYLVVATRPKKQNGFGLTTSDALNNLEAFGTCIQILDESQAVARRLQQLVTRHDLKGKRIHDANLVATMQENGLTLLKTYNSGDFSVFENIQFVE